MIESAVQKKKFINYGLQVIKNHFFLCLFAGGGIGVGGGYSINSLSGRGSNGGHGHQSYEEVLLSTTPATPQGTSDLIFLLFYTQGIYDLSFSEKITYLFYISLGVKKCFKSFCLLDYTTDQSFFCPAAIRYKSILEMDFERIF